MIASTLTPYFAVHRKTLRYADAPLRRFFRAAPPPFVFGSRRKERRVALETRRFFAQFVLIINVVVFRVVPLPRRMRLDAETETPGSRRRNPHF